MAQNAKLQGPRSPPPQKKMVLTCPPTWHKIEVKGQNNVVWHATSLQKGPNSASKCKNRPRHSPEVQCSQHGVWPQTPPDENGPNLPPAWHKIEVHCSNNAVWHATSLQKGPNLASKCKTAPGIRPKSRFNVHNTAFGSRRPPRKWSQPAPPTMAKNRGSMFKKWYGPRHSPNGSNMAPQCRIARGIPPTSGPNGPKRRLPPMAPTRAKRPVVAWPVSSLAPENSGQTLNGRHVGRCVADSPASGLNLMWGWIRGASRVKHGWAAPSEAISGESRPAPLPCANSCTDWRMFGPFRKHCSGVVSPS